MKEERGREKRGRFVERRRHIDLYIISQSESHKHTVRWKEQGEGCVYEVLPFFGIVSLLLCFRPGIPLVSKTMVRVMCFV